MRDTCNSLRTALARLREQVGNELQVSRKTLTLAPQSQQQSQPQVDSVILLQTLANIGTVDAPAKVSTLQTALDAYRGDFLADFTCPMPPNLNNG